jgi:hypothetical protein
MKQHSFSEVYSRVLALVSAIQNVVVSLVQQLALDVQSDDHLSVRPLETGYILQLQSSWQLHTVQIESPHYSNTTPPSTRTSSKQAS